jgi:protein-disulfide isomerase
MVAGVGALFVIGVARRTTASPPPVVTIGPIDAGAPFAPPPAAAPPHAADAGAATATPPSEDLGELPQVAISDVDASRAISVADAAAALPLDDQVPVWGDAQAPATLVVFGDLECPHTRRALGVVLVLKKALGSDLRIAWRNRPLEGNELAGSAAEVAAALHAEHGNGVFWRFIAEAVKEGLAPTAARLDRWIEAAGGDRARVSAARIKHKKRVDRDLELAGRFDVRATPTLFLNGTRIEGYHPLSVLRRQVEQEITVARVVLASGIGSASLYATRVRKNLIGLGSDVLVRACPEIGTSPVRGSSSPLVTIVEFSDFECPYCKRALPTLERVLARYGGDVRLVWKNLPLTSHARARPAAALAQEAYQRGGATSFWRIHDLLFAASSLDDEGLKSIAGKAGLDAGSALEAVRRGVHDSKIEADVKLGKKLGAAGTPTFYLNGRKLEGAVPFERFSVLVQEEIDAAKRLIDNGTPRARIYETICGR